MTPLDDELRTALRGRADALAPAADPLAGIESRARRIQRRRGAAAVLGTTLAVALVAVAVPAVIGSTTSSTSPGPVASRGPTPTTVLDDARPANAVLWPSAPMGDEDLDAAVRTAYARGTGVQPASVRGDQLFLGATPDGARAVGVYQLWTSPGSEAVVLVASAEPGGPALLGSHQTTASSDLAGVVDVVPGGATPWVVALPRPGVTETAYAADGVTFVPVESDERAAVFPRTGPTGAVMDLVRFRGGGVSTTVDVGTRGEAEGQDPGASDGEPANLLADWPARGETPSASLVADAKKGFALSLGRLDDLDDVRYRVLFAGSTDGGLRYVLGQAWFAGETTAYPAAFYADGEQGSEPFVGKPSAVGAKVLAFVPCCSPGLTVDELVVVPAPGAGQVQYGAAGSEWRDVGAGQDHLDGVVIIDRDARDQGDRLRVLDGDGDLDGPYLYEGPVQPLLCGVRECG